LRQLKTADSDAEIIKATLKELGFQVAIEEDRDPNMRGALADLARTPKAPTEHRS
jgi:uncharacterized caspase-like protein